MIFLRLRRGIACLALLATTVAVAQQRDFSQVEIKTQQIGDGLFVLIGSGGNIGLSVGADGPFLVDDQYAPLTDKIRAAVARVSDQPVRFIINTHWHGDHTGGNENFGQAGAIIVAHDNVRTRLQSEQFVEIFEHRAPPSPAGALPIVTFSDTVTLHWNDRTIRAFHMERAHTDGDAIIHFVEDNVFHMGDIYWTSGYPRIDAGNGGSIQGVIAAVEHVLSAANEQTRIIPGHGDVPEPGLGGFRAYADMLRSARAAVQELVDQGMTVEEVVAAAPTAGFDAQWGQSYVTPERFVRTVYVSLTE